MMELISGRPEGAADRSPVELRVYDLLDRLGVSYERIDHQAAMTMEDCAEIDLVLKATLCKNLFLCNRQQTDFYLLMMPGDKPFKTKELSAQIGSSRLSFASPDAMEQYLGLSPGAVSVLGLMNDTEGHVQLLMDEELLSGEYIGCHPCVNTTSLRLRVQDLLKIILPAVGHTSQTVRL